MSDATDPTEQRRAITHWLVGEEHAKQYHDDRHFHAAVDNLVAMLPSMIKGIAVAAAEQTKADERMLHLLSGAIAPFSYSPIMISKEDLERVEPNMLDVIRDQMEQAGREQGIRSDPYTVEWAGGDPIADLEAFADLVDDRCPKCRLDGGDHMITCLDALKGDSRWWEHIGAGVWRRRPTEGHR